MKNNFYQVIIEGMPSIEAANFSKGLKAKEILKICEEKGI
jgi:hypothetical protein